MLFKIDIKVESRPSYDTIFVTIECITNSNPSSMYMSVCTTEEISTIITELKNGIASDILIYKIPYRRAPRLAYQPLGRVRHLHTSDIPIHVIKKTEHVISPILCALYNRYMNEGIFPDELKV